MPAYMMQMSCSAEKTLSGSARRTCVSWGSLMIFFVFLEKFFLKCSIDHADSSRADKSKTVFNLKETMADDNKDKKGRSSYNWFITNGDWDEDEIAQRKADLFFEELCLKKDNRILLIIDDTYNEKKGKHTEGVGKFFDHSKGFIWGNNIVTSVLQAKGLFIPHKAKIYVKKEDAGCN